MADDEFQSLNRGVFVLKHEPKGSDAGPSRPTRPLKRVYDETYQRLEAAYEGYELELADEQLDDVAEWIERCGDPPLLEPLADTETLPVAIIQPLMEAAAYRLSEEFPYAITLHGRDLVDLGAALRLVILGYMGPEYAKPSGLNTMDQLEDWYLPLRGEPDLLLLICDAQLVSSAVLAEFLYVLALHPDIPFHVLLSVPSPSIFLPTCSHIEPSVIDLSILQPKRGRKRTSAVQAILRAAQDAAQPIAIDDEVADELAAYEKRTGGGARAVHKALKYLLLRHSMVSPLATLARQGNANAVGGRSAPNLGARLSDLDSTSKLLLTRAGWLDDLESALDPAPRTALLRALEDPKAFTSTLIAQRPPDGTTSNGDSPHPDERGDLKELETLFGLWRGAGKNVNLWDWLQGFRGIMLGHTADEAEDAVSGEEDGGEEADESVRKKDKVPDETEARLHAAFIRFCEEARMLGLVRAKGKGVRRGADDVVKSIGLV